MKSRYLTNLALIVLAIALYWFNNQADKVTSTNITVSPISLDTINHIMIERADRDSIIINKLEDEWRLISPLKARANPTRVELILSLVNTPSNKQLTITPNTELYQYNITADSTKLTLNDSQFNFGGVEALSKDRYILANKTLHLVNDRIAPLLNANATSFVDNRLFPPKAKISKLDIPYYDQSSQGLDNTQRMVIQNQKGQWTSQPHENADSLFEFIENWQHSHALQILPLSRVRQLEESKPLSLYITLNDQDNSHEYKLLYSDNTLIIIDGRQQLAYQLAPGLIHQLFPKNKP